MSKISNVLRRAEQQKRDLVERERRRAEEERNAQRERDEIERREIELVKHRLREARAREAEADRERKRRLRGLRARRERLPDGQYLHPHPNDMGHKPIVSPAGEVADNGGKQGQIYSGGCEQGKGR